MRLHEYIFVFLIVVTACSEKQEVKGNAPSKNNFEAANNVVSDTQTPDFKLQCSTVLKKYKHCSFDLKDESRFLRMCETLASDHSKIFRRAHKIIVSGDCSSIIRNIKESQKTDPPLYDLFQKLQKNPDGGKNCPL